MKLSIKRCFEESRPVSVLVVPIGENSMFDKHFEVVSSCSELSLIELNRPSDWKPQNSPFQFLRWNSGSVVFDYHRYDRFSNGPGELDNFQSFRRILVVIGLINYPELGNAASRIEDDLEFFARKFPYVIIRRLFIFNYSFESSHGTLPATRDPSAATIFPPEMECEGGSMVTVHLQEVMGNIAVAAILSIEKLMLSCEEARVKGIKPPVSLTLSTGHDDVDDNQDPLWKTRGRRSSGRLRKWMGDLSLQIGSPGDAIDHYMAAISECRGHADILWLAAAFEGYASSILLLIKMGASPEEFLGQNLKVTNGLSPITAAIKYAEDKAMEALSIYAKSTSTSFSILEVECAMRLVRLYASSNSIDREQRVVEGITRAASITGITMQQQAEISMEGALLCKQLGMKRKCALLLYVATLQLCDPDAADPIQQAALSHALLRAASAQYGIDTIHLPSLTPSADAENDRGGACRNDVRYVVGGKSPKDGWVSLRRALLSQLAQLARESEDIQSAAR